MVVRRNPERKEEKEKVRRELLNATLRLAASYGFASLSLREVSREAGIAPTSFYRHFEDMEQLGLALIDESVGPALLSLAEPCRKPTKRPWDIPNRLVDAVFKWLDDEPELVRFMLVERVGSLQSTRGAVGSRVNVLIEEVGDAMRSAEDGNIPPVLAEAIVVLVFESAHKALHASAEHRRAALEAVRVQLGILAAGFHAGRQP